VKHFPVKWDGKEFIFGFGHFTSVDELAEHFASRPVIGGDSGKGSLFVKGVEVEGRGGVLTVLTSDSYLTLSGYTMI